MTEAEKRRQAVLKTRQLFKPEGGVVEKNLKAAQAEKIAEQAKVQQMIKQAANQAPLAANKPMPLPMSKPTREQKPMPLPESLPKSMAIRRGPIANPDMDAMRSQGATVTPFSGMMRDRGMAIPTATDAANMQRGQARQMAEAKAKEPRSYESFGEFLKTMGLGK